MLFCTVHRDDLYLQRCLELARIPGAAVAPNPLVGAVVVHEGKIIGEGWHKQYGGPHAEVNAIRQVKRPELLSSSCLYVSLEPCNHHGKTPPCTDLILKHRIPRVVIGSVDPNPKMQGHSLDRLKAEGVEVVLAEDQTPFIQLNRHFWLNQAKGRPYVTLKWAQSADAFIAGYDKEGQVVRTAITGKEAAKWVHWLRHTHQTILVGSRTVLIDDPRLDVRHWPGRSPIPILLDGDGQLPEKKQVFAQPKVIVVGDKTSNVHPGASYLYPRQSLRELLQALYVEEKVGSILVEGGSETLKGFLNEGLWDSLMVLESPHPLGRGLAAPPLPSSGRVQERRWLGPDLLTHYLPA